MDVFRKEYKPLSDAQKAQMEMIKEMAQELWDVIDANSTPDNGRMMAVAKTNLEQAIMWAVKGLTG